MLKIIFHDGPGTDGPAPELVDGGGTPELVEVDWAHRSVPGDPGGVGGSIRPCMLKLVGQRRAEERGSCVKCASGVSRGESRGH